MRKFIFNGAMVSAVLGLWSTIRSTRSGPTDWRIVLMWVSATISLVIAVGTVIEESKKAEISQKSR